MGRRVPVVHRVEDRVGLVDGEHRRLGDRRELGVGHDDRDLDDPVAVGIEPRHLHVEPGEVVRVLRHVLDFRGVG
jgi:hypothetical protein